jgi:hypothetical protein
MHAARPGSPDDAIGPWSPDDAIGPWSADDAIGPSSTRATGPKSPDDATLLAAWERSLGRARPWRELELLAGVSAEPVDRLAALPIGERDRRLLGLREQAFGSSLECEADCPSCGERLELTLDGASLRAAGRAATDMAVQPAPEAVATVDDDGWHVTFRMPTSSDIDAATDPTGGDRSTEAARLLDQCIVSAVHGGVRVAVADVPESVRGLVAERMEELDPGADLVVELRCPSCAHSWSSPFDPAAYLLDELDSWAGRLFGEVDVLARAYGWREPDVLALGPFRRRRYLELVAG